MSKKYKYLKQQLNVLKREYNETGNEEVKNVIKEINEVLNKSRMYDIAFKITTNDIKRGNK